MARIGARISVYDSDEVKISSMKHTTGSVSLMIDDFTLCISPNRAIEIRDKLNEMISGVFDHD